VYIVNSIPPETVKEPPKLDTDDEYAVFLSFFAVYNKWFLWQWTVVVFQRFVCDTSRGSSAWILNGLLALTDMPKSMTLLHA